jgi:primosomal protein N' (replication factor Y)
MVAMLRFSWLITNSEGVAGSATPGLETYFNSKNDKYGFVELLERYREVKLPSIEMIDNRTIAHRPGEKIMISPQLLEEIRQTVFNHKQVILFQNRRGYAPYQVAWFVDGLPNVKTVMFR